MKTERIINDTATLPAADSGSAFRASRAAFTLIEVMVVVVLLSLIIIALMGVFNSTQAAFRASVTQTDVLESGRAAMDLITGDLREMSPSFGTSNTIVSAIGPAVNFYAQVFYAPFLNQQLLASNPGSPGNPRSRTNVLENLFILSRENQTWTGVGYLVITNTVEGNIFSLYRFSMSTNVAAASPLTLFQAFAAQVNNGAYTNMSHLMDGVVTFRVRAYDPNGLWMTNGYPNASYITVKNIEFDPSILGEVGFHMYSNTLPASVEIELATLEDRTLQRAGSRPAGPVRDQFLQSQAGKVHVFRQRVAIPNVDPAAYQ